MPDESPKRPSETQGNDSGRCVQGFQSQVGPAVPWAGRSQAGRCPLGPACPSSQALRCQFHSRSASLVTAPAERTCVLSVRCSVDGENIAAIFAGGAFVWHWIASLNPAVTKFRRDSTEQGRAHDSARKIVRCSVHHILQENCPTLNLTGIRWNPTRGGPKVEAVPVRTPLGRFPGHPERRPPTHSRNTAPFRPPAECSRPNNSTPAASVTNHRLV